MMSLHDMTHCYNINYPKRHNVHKTGSSERSRKKFKRSKVNNKFFNVNSEVNMDKKSLKCSEKKGNLK